jgi:hypothetical protein
MPGTPDELKEKPGTPCRRNFKNRRDIFVLLVERKAQLGCVNFTSLQSQFISKWFVTQDCSKLVFN